MNTKNLTRMLTGSLLALMCAWPAAAANLAGKTVFVSGKATATAPDGDVRGLKAGDEVYSGDLLETGKGRVQIKYLDGAFMSIQPNSRFKIEDYNFENGADGSEQAIYSLFKGGMRAFTGAIGKKHPDTYKVKTPVATIGIRGTGHNTRICSGDCTNANGVPIPDGLYHSTWEGTTYVVNEHGTSEVPFGNAVYVQSSDSPAEETTDTSQVTAVQESQDAVEELVVENQQQPTYEDGNEYDCEGDICVQDGLTSGGTTAGDYDDDGENPVPALPALNLVSVEPDLADPDSVDIGLVFQTTVFFAGTEPEPIGAYGTDINEGLPYMASVATIDPFAILTSTSPAAADAQALINNALADPDNNELVDEFLADPASIAEYTEDSGMGFGSWANGKVITFNEDGTASLVTLAADQRLHYIFGNSPAVPAANAMGTYDFVGGTRSTTTSGGPINGVSIGDGAISGQLNFDFGDNSGTIAMTVSHGLIYTIEGPLLIDVVFPSLFASNGVMATTTSGDCAEGGCTAFIEGSFFGPLFEGGPNGAGLEYDIQEPGDVITGVAAFTNVTDPDAPPPELTMVPARTLLGITPELQADPWDDENSGEGQFFDTTVLNAVDNRAGMPGMVASIGTETDDEGVDELFEVLLTIDPNGVLDVSAPDSAVALAQDFITDALTAGGADAAAVNAVIDDPAALVEYREDTFEGTFGSSDYALGRWSGGNILFIEEVTLGNNEGTRTVEFDTLAADQSLHFLHGQPADINFGTGATGTYALVDATASSLTAGGSNGSVQPGSTLTFDFTSLNGTLDMDVLHDADLFMVNGALKIDFDSPGEFFDTNVAATTVEGPCDAGCTTIVDGTFFGPLDGAGVDGAPVLAGLDYDIVLVPFDTETPAVGESIIGNALFGRSGTADPIPDTFTVTPGQGLVVVLPNPTQPPPFPDEFADVGLLFDSTTVDGQDRLGNAGMLMAAGIEIDPDLEVPELFVVATIDPDGMLGVSDPDPYVAVAQGMISAAKVTDSALVESVNNDPARLAEYFQGGGFAFGRWADGNVLILDTDIIEGSQGGSPRVEMDTLTENQSLHFIHGDAPDMPAAGATGTYDFTGGTQSTSVSGATIGMGVTSGQLTFDFDTLSGTVAMTVNHLTDYNVSGDLNIDGTSGQFSDIGASAVTNGGNCDTGCATFIDGGFSGALSGGAQASPAFAGLEYDIMDPVDGIMGVAGFDRTGDRLQPD